MDRDIDFWPAPSPPSAFVARRSRLAAGFGGRAALFAGLSRPRNYHGNRHRFRAESHFLYLVGRHLEGAVLCLDHGTFTLYAEAAHPEEALWTGPSASLDELSRELEVAVRPLDELELDESWATLPPPDAEAAFWLSERLGRDVEPAGGDRVEGHDAALADAMIELRLQHDEAAIAQLRQAAVVTARAHVVGMRATHVGRHEASVRGAMEGAMLSCGMGGAYNPIVTVHGEVLHSERHDQLMRAGDLLLADVGAETPEGWAGDVTRVWPVAPRFSATQRALYEVVLGAQLEAIAMVAPGVRYRDVHRAAARATVRGLCALGILRGDAEELYAAGAAALFFPHGVGHLLGLDVHDMEDLGDRAGYAPGRARSTAPGDRYLRCDRDLAPGMVVTIEPGVYLIDAILRGEHALHGAVDWNELERHRDVRGIRIEDDVLVTEAGCEVLTSSLPKRVHDVEAMRAG